MWYLVSFKCVFGYLVLLAKYVAYQCYEDIKEDWRSLEEDEVKPSQIEEGAEEAQVDLRWSVFKWLVLSTQKSKWGDSNWRS